MKTKRPLIIAAVIALVLASVATIPLAHADRFYVSRSWNSQGSGAGTITGPRGIAISADETAIFVGSVGTTNADGFVDKYSIAGSTVTNVARWASIGGNTLHNTEGVATNSAGTLIYIADTGDNEVIKATVSGPSVSLSGAVTGLNAPSGVATNSDGSILYISDTSNNSVKKYNVSGSIFTGAGTLTGLNAPRSVATNDSGSTLYVADTGNNLVKKYAVSTILPSIGVGTQSNSASPTGSGTTKTLSMSGVTITTSGPASGTLTLQQSTTFSGTTTLSAAAPSASGTNAAITLGTITATVTPGTSSSTQTLVLKIPFGTAGPVTNAAVGTMSTAVTLGTSRSVSSQSTSAAPSVMPFTLQSQWASTSPYGLSLDAAGNVYAASQSGNILVQYTSAGVQTGTMGTGTAGSASGQFNAPRAVTVASNTNDVFVADTGNNRVQEFGVDNILPTVGITSPATSTILATNAFAITGTASDNIAVSLVQVKIDSGSFQSAAGTTSWTFAASGLSNGVHTITARATDTAGNTADSSPITVTVDTVAPATPTIASPPNASSTANNTPTFSGSAESGSTVRILGTLATAGIQTNSVTPTTSGNSKTSSIGGGLSITTSAAADGEIILEQTVQFSGTTTLTLGATSVSGTSASLTYGKIYATTTSPGSSASSHTLVVHIPFSTSGPVSNAAIGTVSTPLTLGTSRSINSVTTTSGFPLAGQVLTSAVSSGGTWSANSVNAMGDGTLTYFATAVDAADNISQSTSKRTLTIDTIVPTVSISAPGNNTVLGSSSFIVSGTAGDNLGLASVQVSIDGGTYLLAVGTTSWSYSASGLSDGSHSINARATDNAGNIADSALVTVTVNTVIPPAPSITDPVGPFLTTPTASFAGSAEDTDTVKLYRVYAPEGTQAGAVTPTGVGASKASAISGISVSATGPISGTLTVKQQIAFSGTTTLAAGAPTVTGANALFTIGTLSTAISPGTSAATQTLTITVPFSTSGPASSASFGTINTPLTLGTARSVTGVSAPVAPIINELAGSAVAANGGSWSISLSNSLNEGTHDFYATAVNSVGNTSPASTTKTLTVDTITPAISFTSPTSNAAINTSALTMTGTSSDSGSGLQLVEVQTDGGIFQPATGTNPWTFDVMSLSDGSHSFVARSTDKAGNANTASLSITIDTASPTISLVSPANNTLSGSSVVDILGTASDETNLASVKISVDGGTYLLANGTTSWSYSASGLSDGIHTIDARAADATGNLANAAQVQVIVDASNPIVSITAPAGNSLFSSPFLNVTGTASDYILQKVELQIDSNPFALANGTSSWSFATPALADGTHTFVARATDGTGKSSDSPPVSITIDSSSPTIAIAFPANGEVFDIGSLSVNGTANAASGIAYVELSIDSGAYQPASGTTSWTFALATLTEGKHFIDARTGSNAGNVATATQISITVDLNPPSTSQVSVTPFHATSSPLTVNATVTDSTLPIEAAEYFIDTVGANGAGNPMLASDGDFNALAENATGIIPGSIFTALADGNHTVYVHAKDEAGHWGGVSSAAFEKATIDACNCVVLRIDDIQDYWINSVQTGLMDHLINRNVNATFGVIMNFVGNDAATVNKVREGQQANLFELDLHGWNHVPYDQLSFADQKNTLQMANQKMQDLWGRKTTIFIPPYNAYNNNTLDAANQLGLKIISSEFDQELPSILRNPQNPNDPNNKVYKAIGNSDLKDEFGVYHLPQGIGFYTYDDTVVKTPVSVIESAIDEKIADYGYVVVTLHPQDFAVKDPAGVPSNSIDESELNDLDTLIAYANSKGYDLVTLSHVAKIPLPPVVDNVPPTVTPPADIATVTSANPASISNIGTATAVDNVDPHPVITNNSTGLFPRGSTVVQWSATDANGNVGKALQYVTVSTASDAARPVISIVTPPSGVSIVGPATGVNILVTGHATDGQSGVKKVELRTGPPSNLAYRTVIPSSSGSWSDWSYILRITKPGSTTITGHAMDYFGNEQWSTIPVTISLGGSDVTPPTLTAPPSKTVEATGELTPVSLGTPFVFDNSDLSPQVSNDSPGATESTGFPLGTTAVTWSATDAAGNIATAMQTITVVDTTAPLVPQPILPANQAATNVPVLSFNWSNVTDAASPVTYELLVSGNPNFGSPAVNQVGLNESAFTLQSPLADGSYYWKVRASDASNNKSPYSSVQSFTIDTAAPSVTASPPAGVYLTSQSVTLTSTEPLTTTIYYTIDGSTPDTSSAIYTGPLAISETLALKFFAVDAVGNTSAITTINYVIDSAAPTVTASPSGGLYNLPQQVALTVSEPGQFTIYYTTDGSTPTQSSLPYSSPIAISSNSTLKFFARSDEGRTSLTVSETYTFDTIPPTASASPQGGTYNTAQAVTLTASESATIYYTTNGLTPDTSSAVYGSTPISIPSTADLKFFAKDTAGNNGPVVVEGYVIDTVPPSVTATPAGGTYDTSQSVTLTASKPGSTIYYTTDGSTPTTASRVYAAAIPIIGQGTTTVLKFFAIDSIGNTGQVATETYAISASQFPLTIMSDTTKSGGLTLSSSTQAQVEFVSPTSQLVGKTIDKVTLELRRTGSPTGVAQVGIIGSDLSVTKLFGTKDVSTLTTSYTDYTFTLGNNELYTIQAGDRIGIKYAGGDANNFVAVMRDNTNQFDGQNSYRQQYGTSWVNSLNDDLYMILVQSHGATDTVAPVVTASPVGGTYNTVLSVTLAANKPATIYYTTDGSTPTPSSNVYSSPIQIGSTTTLKFFGRNLNRYDSPISTEVYNINLPVYPVTVMSDTIQSSGLALNAATFSQAEYASSTSSLVGKNIDQITLKLRKTGAPAGSVEIGIFNPDLTVKKSFGIMTASSIAAVYTDYTLSLANNELYTIQAGDRIGIKSTGGDSTNFIAVMRDTTNQFDGTNSYRQQYATSWTSATSDDLYMTLKQTHG